MARTFLQLIQQAANEIGIPQPTQLFGSQQETAIQLIALANREAKEFSSVANKNGGWQDLHEEYSFDTQILTVTGDVTEGSAVVTNLSSVSGLSAEWGISSGQFRNASRILTVDSPTQVTMDNPSTVTGTGVTIIFGRAAYPLPSNFEYFVEKTFWDNRYRWELIGPITAQEKQILKYGVIASGPRNKFYVRKNMMWLDPIPASVFKIAYDYYSNSPISTSTGSFSQTWTSDNDTYLLDEDCFIQGMKWRFLRAKGLDYIEEYDAYEGDVSRTISRDGGSRDLPLGDNLRRIHFLNGGNIPDTGYGQ